MDKLKQHIRQHLAIIIVLAFSLLFAAAMPFISGSTIKITPQSFQIDAIQNGEIS